MNNDLIPLGQMPCSTELEAAHSWCEVDATTFPVRGPTYDTDREKVFSFASFYTTVSVDFLFSPAKPAPPLVPKLKLPPVSPAVLALPRPVDLPLQVVVILNYPRYCPSIRGPPNNGENLTSVVVMEIRPEVVKETLLDESEQSNALKLFRAFCRDPIPYRTRIKFIHRLEENNLKSVLAEYLTWTTQWLRILAGYNGKPVLCKEAINIIKHDEDKVFEIMWDHHVGPYMPRYGLYYFKDLPEKFILEIAVLIEGRGEDQQPERIIGTYRVNRPDVTKFTVTTFDDSQKGEEEAEAEVEDELD
eukprot:c2810_g1_i1.p1 GENE.c2810_g1_i1~~c2810_g1_i1.p1  ORF type:complete len:318 (-),score=60.44 c2810_g1_i1:19-927(-)